MKLFCAILQFMTRIPVPASWTRDLDFQNYAKGIVWFPCVGLVVGALASGVFVLIRNSMDIYLAAASYVLALALLTGAFHLDGLADTCDGIFSARTRERMLEIMHDSRLGTNGGLALLFIILFRVLVVARLATVAPHLAPFWLWATPVASRSLMVILMYRQPYARESGLGNVFIGKVTGSRTLIALVSGLVLVAILVHGAGVAAWLGTLFFAYAYQRFIHHRIGGQTGDTLGGGNELFELFFIWIHLVWLA